jgi:pimeloyl-ACP methyl ester carboxylesterase
MLVACLEEAKTKYGTDLRFYTATNAARDLARAIELTRPPGAKVVVYGASYGTTWAQRFMQVAPAGADAVVLDSIVAPGEQFLSDFDRQGDMVAKKLAEACKTNAACSGALGPDPWAFVAATKQKLDQGIACPELGMAPRDRVRFTELLRPWPTMMYALAAWKRLDRCAPGDVAALKQLAKRIPFHGPNEALNSEVLHATSRTRSSGRRLRRARRR